MCTFIVRQYYDYLQKFGHKTRKEETAWKAKM
jgi:hypothetical protein